MGAYGTTQVVYETSVDFTKSNSPTTYVDGVTFLDTKGPVTVHYDGSITSEILRSTFAGAKLTKMKIIKKEEKTPGLTEKELSCLRVKDNAIIGGIALIPIGMIGGAVATFGATAVATAWVGALIIGSLTVGVAECTKVTHCPSTRQLSAMPDTQESFNNYYYDKL